MAGVVAFVASTFARVAVSGIVRRLIINAGIQIALSAVTKKLTKSNDRGIELAQPTPQQLTNSGSIVPRALIYGSVTKAGTVFFQGTAGPQNQDLWELHAFAGHEIEAFDTLHLEGYRSINLSTDIDPQGFCTLPEYINSDNEKLLRVLIRTGNVDQAAMTEVIGAFGTTWTTNHRARGVAYLGIRFRFDDSPGSADPNDPNKSVWDRGRPLNVRATLRGKKVYDPRQAGQSPTDATNWAFSDNAALCTADYLRSHPDARITGTFGDSYERIDYAQVSVEADICDQAVTIPNGLGGTTTQKRYTVDASFTLDTQPSGIYEVLRQCLAGSVVYSGGKYSILCGATRPIVATIDGDWLAGRVSKQSGARRGERFNTVRGQYVSRASLGQLIDFTPVSDAALIARDGETITREMTIVGGSDEYRAQRLATLEQRHGRTDSIISMGSKLHALQLNIGDYVNVPMPEVNADGVHQVEEWELSRLSPEEAPIVNIRVTKVNPLGFDIDSSDLTEVFPVSDLTQSTYTPSAVTSGIAIGGVGQIVLEWVNPPQNQVKRVEIWSSVFNDRTTATKRSQTTAEEFIDVLPSGATRYYWLIIYGINSITSDWFPASPTNGLTATTIAITGGADAIGVDLLSDLEKFSFDSDGTPNPASQTATLTVDRQNIIDSPGWSTSPLVNLGGAANAVTRTLSVADFGANERVTITVTVGSFIRNYIIGRTINGQDGSSSVSVSLSNENVTVNTDENFIGSLGQASGSMSVFEGQTDQTIQSTFSVLSQSGGTFSIDAAGNYQLLTVSALTAQAIFRANFDGKAYTKVFSVTVNIVPALPPGITITPSSGNFIVQSGASFSRVFTCDRASMDGSETFLWQLINADTGLSINGPTTNPTVNITGLPDSDVTKSFDLRCTVTFAGDTYISNGGYTVVFLGIS